MDGATLFSRLLDKRGLNPNSLAAAINRPKAQSTFHRFKEGTIRQPKRESLEDAAAHLGVNVLAFYDPDLADQEWGRISGAPAPAPQAAAAQTARQVTESQWAMLQDFEILPEDEKAALRGTLRQNADRVRKIVAEYLGRQGVSNVPATNERVEEAYGAPPPPPGPGGYVKQTEIPREPVDTPKRREGR